MIGTPVNATCRVGQREACGEPATRLIAVTTVADTGWAENAREGGVVGLCEHHATTPPSDWDNPR